jgi:hypothetical protein
MFHKILAALDRSEMSNDVFKTALNIAKADKAVVISHSKKQDLMRMNISLRKVVRSSIIVSIEL